MNKEFLLGLAASFPREMLADRLLEDAKNFIIDPTEENENILTMSAHIWMISKVSGGTPEGINDMFKEMETNRKRVELFEIEKN